MDNYLYLIGIASDVFIVFVPCPFYLYLGFRPSFENDLLCVQIFLAFAHLKLIEITQMFIKCIYIDNWRSLDQWTYLYRLSSQILLYL